MTDAELLAIYAKNHSEDALRALIERHIGLVYAAAIRQVRDPADAEDIVQGIFMTLSTRASKLHAKAATLPGWLLIAAHYAARNVLRRRARRLRHEQKAAVMQTASSPTVDSEKLFSMLDEALRRLSPADRTAIALYYLENQSLRDVGNALAISEGAAQMRVRRALSRLRTVLERIGVTCPADAFEESLHRCGSIAPPAALLSAVTNGILHPTAASPGSTLITQHLLKAPLIKKAAITVLTAVIFAAVAAPLGYHLFSGNKNITPLSSLSDASSSADAATNAAPAAIESPAPTSSPFTATLPNGISIELLGVSDFFKRYWAPDGSPLQNSPQNWISIQPDWLHMVSDKQSGIIWTARFGLPPAKDITYKGYLAALVGHYAPDLESTSSTAYTSSAILIPKSQSTGTIHFDIATGPWQTVLQTSGQATTGYQAEFGNLTLGPASQVNVDVQVGVTFSDDVLTKLENENIDLQTVVLKNDGRTIIGAYTYTLRESTTDGITKATLITDFVKMRLNEIKQISFQMRPYDLFVEFQNVSLVPNQRTNVQIETGNNIN